jgi:hypothetical protein
MTMQSEYHCTFVVSAVKVIKNPYGIEEPLIMTTTPPSSWGISSYGDPCGDGTCGHDFHPPASTSGDTDKSADNNNTTDD